MPFNRLAFAVALLVSAIPPLSIAPRPLFAAQGEASATVAAVTRALSGNGELRRLKVTVEGSEVTLTGRLPNLWHKMDAVKRALKVDGIKTVRLDVELPRQESDKDLALFLGAAIDRYPYYTMFDYLDAVIRNGVVTLTGWVTPEGKKSAEIEEEVAKVRGVQEIKNEIVTLTPSQNDESIREDLLDRISSSEYFEQFANVHNPPFRIVVQNGNVTLYGRVQGEVERRQLETFARYTSGVLKVQNNLQTIIKPKPKQ
jgi:hyperosmotically inducible periplasmic protein